MDCILYKEIVLKKYIFILIILLVSTFSIYSAINEVDIDLGVGPGIYQSSKVIGTFGAHYNGYFSRIRTTNKGPYYANRTHVYHGMNLGFNLDFSQSLEASWFSAGYSCIQYLNSSSAFSEHISLLLGVKGNSFALGLKPSFRYTYYFTPEIGIQFGINMIFRFLPDISIYETNTLAFKYRF